MSRLVQPNDKEYDKLLQYALAQTQCFEAEKSKLEKDAKKRAKKEKAD